MRLIKTIVLLSVLSGAALGIGGCDSAELLESDLDEMPGEEEVACAFLSDGLTVLDSLAAYYPLNGDALDYSGHCRDAEALGSYQFTDGIDSLALQFNGTSTILRIGAQVSPLPATRSTIVFWIRQTQFLERDSVMEVASWPDCWMKHTWSASSAGYHRWYSTCDQGGGQIWDQWMSQWLMVTIRSLTGRDSHKAFRVRVASPDLSWHSLWDSEAGVIEGGGEILFGAHDSDQITAPNRFGGLIDEIRIYNKILTAEEEKMIFDHYHGY